MHVVCLPHILPLPITEDSRGSVPTNSGDTHTKIHSGKHIFGNNYEYSVSGMKPFPIPRTLAEAKAIQRDLRRALESGQDISIEEPERVAGMGVSYGDFSAYAALVIEHFPDLTFQSRVEARSSILFPYIPGFFAFREIPPVLEAFSLLKNPPDLILVHGHGYAHPERIGLATHLGAHLRIPSIGIAGSPLSGMEGTEPGTFRGAHSGIAMNGEVVGELLRTQEHLPPVCISAGYRTTLSHAREITLACCTRSRFPEPVVLAVRAAKSMRKRTEKNLFPGKQV